MSTVSYLVLFGPGGIHMALSAQRTLTTSRTRSSCPSISLCSPSGRSSGPKVLKGNSKVQKNVKCKCEKLKHTYPQGVSPWNGGTDLKCSLLSFSVKRYVRKGIPNEHRALIWMTASGAQDQLEKNPGYYQSLLGAKHDPKLVDTISTGQAADRFNSCEPWYTSSQSRRACTRKGTTSCFQTWTPENVQKLGSDIFWSLPFTYKEHSRSLSGSDVVTTTCSSCILPWAHSFNQDLAWKVRENVQSNWQPLWNSSGNCCNISSCPRIGGSPHDFCYTLTSM